MLERARVTSAVSFPSNHPPFQHSESVLCSPHDNIYAFYSLRKEPTRLLVQKEIHKTSSGVTQGDTQAPLSGCTRERYISSTSLEWLGYRSFKFKGISFPGCSAGDQESHGWTLVQRILMQPARCSYFAFFLLLVERALLATCKCGWLLCPRSRCVSLALLDD
jgi:hypothetical protein